MKIFRYESKLSIIYHNKKVPTSSADAMLLRAGASGMDGVSGGVLLDWSHLC